VDIDGYTKAYDEVYAKVNDKDVAIFLLGQVAKDRRTDEINKNGGNNKGNGYSNGNVLATPSQVSYLKRLGIAVKDGMTKAEASKLIDEAKAK